MDTGLALSIISLALVSFYGFGRWLQKRSKPIKQYEKLPAMPLGKMEPWRLFELGWPNNGGVKYVVVQPMESPGKDIVPILGPGENYYELHPSTPVSPLRINW